MSGTVSFLQQSYTTYKSDIYSMIQKKPDRVGAKIAMAQKRKCQEVIVK